jgi:hypothetical protein
MTVNEKTLFESLYIIHSIMLSHYLDKALRTCYVYDVPYLGRRPGLSIGKAQLLRAAGLKIQLLHLYLQLQRVCTVDPCVHKSTL